MPADPSDGSDSPTEERGRLATMHIALVKKRYTLQHGGSERYCVNLARQLRTQGHRVTVIGQSIDEELCDEVEFIPVRVNNMTSSTRNQSFAENCGRVASSTNFDLVYGLGRSFGLDAVRITERLQSHWITVRYRHPMARLIQRINPRHRTLISLERSIYGSRDVRRIVAQSSLDRRLVSDYYGVPDDKIRVIYNGVDTTLFSPAVRQHRAEIRTEFGIAADEPLLLFASMDFEGKGLRTVLSALRAGHQRETRLLVLGKGDVVRFEKLAREYGVDRRVTFAGRRCDIQRFYGAADLFLLPTTYEPFPNVNLEALACGTPVVTTATAGGADVITPGKNGYLISDSRSVEELAECLDLHFQKSAMERAAISNACWEVARHLTLENNTRQTLEMFEEVLLEKHRV